MLILLIPYLLLAMLLLAAWLFVRRKRVAGAVLLAVVLVVNCFVHCFAVHPFRHRDGGLKVMSWNIQGTGDPGTARAVADMVERLDPDVFCAVEVWHRTSKVLDSLLRNHCGYILAGAAGEIVCYSKLHLGEVLPVENAGGGLRLGFSVDGGDTLNMTVCHLASNNYDAETARIAPIDSVSTSSELQAYLRNITAAGQQRESQAESLCEGAGLSHPTIILGDMNDLWSSAALRVFDRKGFRDAWWDGGFGYGSTIHHPLSFRIDHILYSDRLRLRSVGRVKACGLSDHDALVASFDLNQPDGEEP